MHHDLVPSLGPLKALDRSRDWDEFRAVARAWPYPGMNMVYADVDGNIGYQCSGTVPVRPEGVTGGVPQPGWTSAHEWQGTIRLPSFRPPSIRPPV